MREKSKNWARRRPAQEVNINKVKEDAYAEALALSGYYDTVEELNLGTTLQLAGYCIKCMDSKFDKDNDIAKQELVYVVKLCTRTKRGQQLNMKRHLRGLQTSEYYESVARLNEVAQEIIDVLATYTHFASDEFNSAQLHLHSLMLRLHMDYVDTKKNIVGDADQSKVVDHIMQFSDKL